MTRTLTPWLALAVLAAACGPDGGEVTDAAIIIDAAPREASLYPDAAPPIDADLTDRPMRDYVGPVLCSDVFESDPQIKNDDAREAAQELTRSSNTINNLGLCYDRDVDYYFIGTHLTDSFAATIYFTHYDGDLVLDLLGPDGSLVTRSDTSSFTSGNEAVFLPSAGEVKYFLRVTSKHADDRVPYRLKIDYLHIAP